MRITRALSILLATASLFGVVNPASACAYGARLMRGSFDNFLAADYIVLGKVTAVEDCTTLTFDPERPTQPWRVATITVTESLKGARGLGAIRVGFTPMSEPQVGAEGCFYLIATTHSFSTLGGVYPTYRGNEKFEETVAEPRRLGRLWENPGAGLRSKDADDRLLTAGLLLDQYRGRAPREEREGKLVAIDKEYSQLILEVLAEADWSKPAVYRQTAPRLFGLLALTAKEGWTKTSFKTPAEFEEAAKAWLKDHIVERRIPGVAARN